MSETYTQPESLAAKTAEHEELWTAGELRSQAISFPLFLEILKHGRRTIAFWAFGGLVLATVLAFLLPPTYTATASFVPPGSNTGSASAAALMGQLSALGGGSLLGSKGQGDLYVGILKSRTIARALVQQFDLERVYKSKKESQAEKVLGSQSLFTQGTKDPIVTISVTDKSPERARDLANGYLQALQSTAANLALTESSQRRLFYEQRLAREKDALADSEVALKQVQEKTGLIAPAGQTGSEIATLAQMEAQITDRRTRLAALLQEETDQNPDVVQMRSEIASLESEVEHLQSGQAKGRFGQFSTAQVPGMELDYIRKARDVKYHEALFEIIAKQYEAARLDEAKDSPLQVLDRAMVPDLKSGPHRSLILGLGLLVGLLGGAGWVLFQVSSRKLSRSAIL